MQFAQKSVSLQRGLVNLERGSIRGADIYDYKEAVGASWDAQFLQLGAGTLDANIDYLTGEGFTLYRESWRQRLHLVGTLLPGMIVIGIPAGTGEETRWWGSSLPGNCITVARSSDEVELITGIDESLTVLTMLEADFLKIFQRLTGLQPSDFPEKGNFLQLKEGAAQRILHLWNSALAQTSVSGTSEWSVIDLIAPLLDALELPVFTKHVQSPRSDLLHRIMNTAMSSDFRASVSEICFEANISRRTMEYVFQELMGESPRSYFTKRRLNLCNQALTEANHAEATVTAIATSFGFYELGRFAAVYHRYFGELPSDTLRRSRRGNVHPLCRPHRSGFLLPKPKSC